MLYCKKCMLLVEKERCPLCNKKKLREPMPQDLVFLTEKQGIWCGVELLNDRHISFIKRGARAAAFILGEGSRFNSCRYYIPYEAHEEASEIIKEAFSSEESEDEEISWEETE